MQVEMLEVRKVNTIRFGQAGWFEVVMSNKDGFMFPLVMNSKTVDKITGKETVLPKVVKFTSLEQATAWLKGGARD